MTALTAANVTPTAITISWPTLTSSQTGGDPIIFYSVEGSPDRTTWTVLNNGGLLALNYTHTLAGGVFPAGSTVFYRVRAQNNVGLSSVYSAVLSV
jgi:hypothetical protein